MGPSLDDLIASHHSAVHAYVRLHAGPALRSSESCSDIAQSVLLKALEAREQFEFRSEPEFRKWLMITTDHEILDRRRHFAAGRRNPERTVPLADDLLASYGSFCTPSRDAVAKEEFARVDAAFDRLPEEYRQVISLRRLLGMSPAEVAEAMGRSEDALRMLLNRALSRLAREMEMTDQLSSLD